MTNRTLADRYGDMKQKIASLRVTLIRKINEEEQDL